MQEEEGRKSVIYRKGPQRRTLVCFVGSNRGVALLMVLWILAILMAIVLSFAFATRTDTLGTTAFKEGMEKRLIAQAGVERGITELVYRITFKGQQAIPDTEEPVRIDGTEYQGSLGRHAYSYRVSDESGKINLNLMTDSTGLILNNLLVSKGVPKEDADVIVDSLLDWIDSDDIHRLHGAESDYYSSLPSPYKAKNDKVDTIEEILLVKGMSREILYGTNDEPGILDCLTVHSKSAGINIISAPKDVVAALPGATPEMAERIVDFRRTTSNATELQNGIKSIVGGAYNQMAPYITTTESSVFTIESVGYKKKEEKGVVIKAIVEMKGGGSYRYLYYKSPAGLKSRETGTEP
jgi:general secretion pathway protein K